MLPIQCLSLVAVLLAATGSQGANILGVFPFPAPSHLIVMTSLMKELALQGHHVTVITPIEDKKPPPNYKQIVIDVSHKDSLKDFNMFDMQNMSPVATMLMLWGMGSMVSEMALSKPQVQELIHSTNHKFDAVVIEAFFNECLLGFAHKFQAPIIQICPFGGAEWMGDAVGNPHFYSYIPDFNLEYSERMSFHQRVHNTALGLFNKVGRALYYIPKQNAIMQKIFAGTGPGPLPHLSDLDRRTSLLLLNHHVSLGSAKPYMPNIVEVGGMHIKPAQKLPQDLQQFLDSATEGVVYFSMGSNLKSAELPADKRDGLLKAFSQIKQKVLWKWEDDVLPGQPPNVKLGKWLPQSDLLAHPNVRVFITHGGLLSTQEAVYNGVPVIGIPIFGDQQMNMNTAVNAGYGRLLPFSTIGNHSAVVEALHDVLNTPTYRDKALVISRRFRDQPRTPLSTAVFWTEYVLRHKGAYHMRSAALDLAWYQYYLLDVIGLIVLACLLVLSLLWVVLRAVLRCIRPARRQAAQGKKNK